MSRVRDPNRLDFPVSSPEVWVCFWEWAVSLYWKYSSTYSSQSGEYSTMRFDLPSIPMKKLSVTKLIGEIFSATMTATTDDSHMNRLSSQPSPSKISKKFLKEIQGVTTLTLWSRWWRRTTLLLGILPLGGTSFICETSSLFRASVMRIGPPPYSDESRSRSNTVKSTDTIPPALMVVPFSLNITRSLDSSYETTVGSRWATEIRL